MLQKNYLQAEFDKYQFLAVKIASRYKNYNVEQKDLVQASYLGLVTGLNKCNYEDERHKINYLSKYILGEIVLTLKSYNNYSYNKEYFKTLKCVNENEELSINELVDKYNLSKEVVVDILVCNKEEEKIIDNNNYFLNSKQNQIYDLIVLRKYSVTKTAKFLRVNRNYILKELKEIYNIIKK